MRAATGALRWLIQDLWQMHKSKLSVGLYCRGNVAQCCSLPYSSQAGPTAHWTSAEASDLIKVADLVRLFRSRGHLSAGLDPLKRTAQGIWLGDNGLAKQSTEDLPGLLEACDRQANQASKAASIAEWLCLSHLWAPSRQYAVEGVWPGGPVCGEDAWQILDLVTHLRDAYCSSLAVEMDHLSRQEQHWIAQRMETQRDLEPQARLALLKELVEADAFERFLALKFPGTKRFGVEGCEALLPGMREVARVCAGRGARQIFVGMPHRGRLNVLCTLLGKPPGALFAQMNNTQSQFHVGDVKYHLGQSATLSFPSRAGKGANTVRVSVAPNPSHLEAINPVVQGMVRAEQARLHDHSRRQALGLLVHGDAAFAGLGLAAETLQLANVPGFTTGGMLHLIINNQTGFTTSPGDGRSSQHPSDMAKAIGAPVWHANADDPEAVMQACTQAAEWRSLFRRDAVVDLVGYRRYGHNELEDPMATLPLAYGLIVNHPPVVELYSKKLQEAGLVGTSEVRSWQEKAMEEFEREFKQFEGGAYSETPQQWLLASWQGDALQSVGASAPQQEPTGLPLPTLQWVGQSICQPRPGAAVHPAVTRLMQNRRKMMADADSRVDFAMAEALAFGALALHRGVGPASALQPAPGSDVDDSDLDDEVSQESARAGLNRGAYAIRLTGQDSERGTFDQRHAVLYDQVTGARQVALNCLHPNAQETVEVWNSPLNEAGVLGFEYGYSLRAKGSALVLWEAQFGDFANNAQAIIDQFVAAGEERWGQQSGLVLLLPHGYEGQGPDHSSARPERFLQLVNDDPAHLPGLAPLQRQQIKRTFEALSREHGRLKKAQAVNLLEQGSANGRNGNGGRGAEAAELLWAEMGLADDAFITEAAWTSLMVQYMRRNAERHANITVAAPTTPAQLFHILRRQVNRPFSKPLVLLMPKGMHLHRHATSALQDFGPHTFFNRIIDDGKVSDNTRHLAHHPRTGAAFTVPAPEVRRVILCSGGVYYLLSRVRRARRVRDVVLIRLEQIAPFPHDLVVKAVEQYKSAEVVWCQEEPKNMGAWHFVKPRYETAMQELTQSLPAGSPARPRELRYVGRAAAASPATASMAIHQTETRHLVDTALSDKLIPSGAEDFVSHPAAQEAPSTR